jgi:hypothetical protein
VTAKEDDLLFISGMSWFGAGQAALNTLPFLRHAVQKWFLEIEDGQYHNLSGPTPLNHHSSHKQTDSDDVCKCLAMGKVERQSLNQPPIGCEVATDQADQTKRNGTQSIHMNTEIR